MEGSSKQNGDGKPGGILRMDLTKPRRSSGGFVEFRQPDRLGSELLYSLSPSSPQPSVDRLSVTWADAEDSSSRVNVFTPGSPPAIKMEVRFPDEEISEDEDYSASVSAIMQRRVSTRRSKRGPRGSTSSRRTSSPFIPEIPGGARRRSSAYTTSSGETAISIEDVQEVTQEQIYENIRLHKEVLGSVKQQPWGMKRKLRLVSQAKTYIKKHEGTLQERLAQNKCTRDILARFNILMARQWQRLKREAANFSNWMIPWELRIKEIESHFGSVVASYFTFLRWLFWVNVVISVVLVVFVVVPESLIAGEDTGERKKILDDEKANLTIRTIWEFEGILKYSPVFYGFYNIREPSAKGGYHLPMAYLMTGLAVYIYSFVAILRKMAENSRMSKLSEKEDECIFSWKLFTGWDYMIGNAETAHNKTASIILGFKEALLEEAEKVKVRRNWKVLFQRILVNICIIILLCASAYAVVEVVNRSKEPDADSNLWRQNEITIVISLISFIFPNLFELFGLLEQYHPRRQLRIQLARIMVLNLLNLYSFIFASFDKISEMTNELRHLRPNSTITTLGPFTAMTTMSTPMTTNSNQTMSTISLSSEFTSTSMTETNPNCFKVIIPCPTSNIFTTTNLTATVVTIMLINQTNFESTLPYNQNITDFYDDNFTYGEFNVSHVPYVDDNVTMLQWESTTETIYNSTETYYQTDSTSEYPIDYNGNYTYEEFDYKFVEEDDKTVDIPPLYTPPAIKNNSSENNPYVTESTEEDDIANDIIMENDIGLYQKPCFEWKCDETYDTGEQLKTFDNSESKLVLTKELIPKHNALITDKYEFKSTESRKLDEDTRKKLRKLCWETMFGQELVKLTNMDLVLTILATIFMDFIRAIFVRFMNKCWCWDLEKKFPQYGDFKIAENILHLVNNQGMVWMGMFFSPGLVVINLVKLIIIMYLRSWAVMTCNVPHEVVFRASRSNNFYFALLLTMIFLCVLPVGYAIVWVEPSWHCGPFSNYQRIYHLFTQSLQSILSPTLRKALDYIASPGIVIPLLVLLILIIYYLSSLTGSLREANNDLKIQLRRERTEERRKMFQMADKRSRGDNELENTPFAKWRKILPTIPANKQNENDTDNNETKGTVDLKKDSLAKLVKLAMRKSSGTSDDESILAAPQQDDETDTEFHESLPDDVLMAKDIHITKQVTENKVNENVLKKKHNSKHVELDKDIKNHKDDENKNKNINGILEKAKMKDNNRKQRANTKSSMPEDDVFLEKSKPIEEKNQPGTSKSSQEDNRSNKDFRNIWKGKISLKKEEVKSDDVIQNDSASSIIPVITISKTASEENVLKEKGKSLHDDVVNVDQNT